jgi:hypothetical protein
MQILERQDEIEGIIGRRRLKATKNTCDGWNKWVATLPGAKIDQNDSGEPILYELCCYVPRGLSALCKNTANLYPGV